MSPSGRSLVGVALAALVVRLALLPWFAGVEPRIYDERDYDRLAVSLAEHGELALDGERSALRPPLYPALVAMVYRVAGVGDYQALRLLQVLLNVVLVPVVFALGRRLYDSRTGLVASGLVAFYPSLWGHDYLVLTEVLFTLLLCAGTLALIGLPARPGWLPPVAGGALFGLASLARSSLFVYPPLFAIVLFAFWRESPSRRRITAVALFAAAFALATGPWIARNSRLLGALSPIDVNSTATVAIFSPMGGSRAWWEEWREPPSRPAAESVAVAAATAAGPADPVRPAPEEVGSESARPRQPRGGRERSPPEPAVRRWARSVVRNGLVFWQIDRELVGAAARGWLGPIPRPAVIALAAIVAGYYAVLAMAGLAGLVLRPPANRVSFALVLSVVAALWGVHAVAIAHSRYHIPVMPFLAVFAARLWVARAEPAPRRRLLAAGALAALLVASWAANFVREDVPDLRKHLARAAAREAGR